MSEFKAAGFSDEFNGGPDLVGITTMTSPYYFVPPSGSTAERPQSAPPGMLRFNTDIGRLEVWRNDHWATILGESPNLGDQNNSNSSGGTGTRALIMGGQNPSGDVGSVEYLTISTLGNSQTFGNLSVTRSQGAGCASRVRGYMVGGFDNPSTLKNEIDSHEFASTGNFVDYGDLQSATRLNGSCSNSTRGLSLGGIAPGATDRIDYFHLATTGAEADFGNLSATDSFGSALASPVRGVYSDGSSDTNTLEYITISSTGNAQNFGDLSQLRGTMVNSAANSTRGIFAGGDTNPGTPAVTNTIDFITIATTGNASDFGDLTRTTAECNGAAASPTRAIFAGQGPSAADTIDYIEILSTGNAVDFGNLGTLRSHAAGCSNSHGGL